MDTLLLHICLSIFEPNLALDVELSSMYIDNGNFHFAKTQRNISILFQRKTSFIMLFLCISKLQLC